MKLVFDIGCNKGEFTQAVREKYPFCKVICVDANKDFSKLPIYTATPGNVFCNALVAEEPDDQRSFYVEQNQTGISTASISWKEQSRFGKGSKYLPPSSGNWDRTDIVKTTTIEELEQKYGTPDFIKIDVEGYENNVIRGMNGYVSPLCFEWVEEDRLTLHHCLTILLDFGYKEFGIVGYFEEGDVFDFATYSEYGDPYLEFPKNYYNISSFDVDKLIVPERRVNYGMCYAR